MSDSSDFDMQAAWLRRFRGGAESNLKAFALRLKQAMPGALLAVTTANARAAYAALQGAPGIEGLLLMGDRVHVRVDDADRRLPDARAGRGPPAELYSPPEGS